MEVDYELENCNMCEGEGEVYYREKYPSIVGEIPPATKITCPRCLGMSKVYVPIYPIINKND